MTETGKKAFIYGIIGSIGALALYATYSIMKQVRLIKQMKVTFGSAKLLPNVGKDMGVKIILNVENTSNLNIMIDMVNFDIYMNGLYINKILQKTSQQVSGKTTSKVEFNVYFNPLELMQGFNVSLILSAIDYKNIDLRIVGYVNGSVDGISFANFPFELNEKLGKLLSKN